MLKIKTIKDFKNLKDKKILLRVDFNVPVSKGKITDDYRIISTLPTIRYLLTKKCKIIIMTHWGKPGGKKIKEYSTKKLAVYLSEKINKKIDFIDDCIGSKVFKKTEIMKNGDILFLENLRYYKEEEKNDIIFASQLAQLGDVYVNDAFGVSHRKNASVSAITNFLSPCAGLLLESELLNLEKIFNPKKPLIVLIGGAKIKTKIALIKKIQKNALKILIGGALANNFFASKNYEVGESLIDTESIKIAKKLTSPKIILPIDVVAGENEKIKVKKIDEIKKNEKIFDIGPETIKLYSNYIQKARTVIWNGPMGMFEIARFKTGTKEIARSVALNSKAFGVVGGGETVEALKLTGMSQYVDWVSTGGGAMLSYLGKEKMPGLKKIIKS